MKTGFTNLQDVQKAVRRIEGQIEMIIDFFDGMDKRSARVWMACEDGSNIELEVKNTTGPDCESEWLCLLKWLRSLQNGKAHLMIQLGNDYETRITPKAPAEMLDKMIAAIKEQL